jgi:hypothetical protein
MVEVGRARMGTGKLGIAVALGRIGSAALGYERVREKEVLRTLKYGQSY